MSALLSRGGWFDRTFREGLTAGKRFHTFRAALTLLENRKPAGALIVETGCQRDALEWGAGCSTTVLGGYCARTGGKLVSVDNDRGHLDRCAAIIQKAGLGDHVELCHDDSAGWLEARRRIDLLYLDSYDYPYGQILEAYGGKADIEQARKIAEGMSDEMIVDRHGPVIAACQEHCLAEIRAAAPSLEPGCVVLIDDVLPGGGKPRLAAEWMRSQGWLHVIEDYQTLWVVR